MEMRDTWKRTHLLHRGLLPGIVAKVAEIDARGVWVCGAVVRVGALGVCIAHTCAHESYVGQTEEEETAKKEKGTRRETHRYIRTRVDVGREHVFAALLVIFHG